MISYGSGGCGGCVRFIERVEQPLFDGQRKDGKLAKPKKKPRRPKDKAVRPYRMPVLCVEKCELFQSITKAAEWLIDQGIATSLTTASGALSNAVSGRQQTAYGMHWKRMDGRK